VFTGVISSRNREKSQSLWQVNPHFRSSSLVVEMGGQTQTQDLPADRKIICRIRKTNNRNLRCNRQRLYPSPPESSLAQYRCNRHRLYPSPPESSLAQYRCNRHRLYPSPTESSLAQYQIFYKINNASNIEDITEQNLETAEVEEILHNCDSVYQPTEQDVIIFI